MRVGFIGTGDAVAPVVAALRQRPGVEVVEVCGGEPVGGLDALVTDDPAALGKARGMTTIGLGCADPQFDHMLVASGAIRERLVRQGFVIDRISVVGDPRFDAVEEAPATPFGAGGRPTVLYSPVVSPRRSSWYDYGRAVLEHFLRDESRNLIFAPDPRLFARNLHFHGLHVGRSGAISRQAYDAPNIHVDLNSGGAKWAAVADICLGDAGTAVDAFLREPRPCLFLGRRHGAAAHWLAGEVIADASNLGAALDRAVATHDHYRSFQEILFARRADVTVESAAERAARAILSVVAPSAPVPLFGQRQAARQDGLAAA